LFGEELMNDSLKRVLARFTCVARLEIRKKFNSASCIPSTRVTIDVLHEFGFEAEPLSVAMWVVNTAYMKAVNAGDEPPDNERESNEWFARTGAWSKAIGDYGNDGETTQNTCITGAPFKPSFICLIEPDTPMFLAEGKWNGHLVAHLPKYHLLVDASADQANEPTKNILLPGVITIPVPNNRFLRGDEPVEGYINGCFVRYTVSSNRDFLQSDAWKDESLTQSVVKAICRAIRKAR
jgi:hypothetical protein